jgi:glucose/arabinose dehydrogenase
MTLSLRLTLIASFTLLTATAASAATVPSGFSETLVAGGINGGTAMAMAPDGRIFVCEKNGRLRVIKNNALLAAPFATVSVNAVGERGLLGVALDPAFSANGFVYVYYTTSGAPMHHRVVRFTAAGDVAAGSETLIFRLNDTNAATNHNGGALHFGADGKLYIATGDNSTASNAQTLANLFGKILRINSDGSIPADNPFYNTATGSNRAIWALGLRNPFTFAFEPDGPLMHINDVGQNSWEEINRGAAGANYGWPATEGLFTASAFPSFTNPRFVYGHGNSATTGCAITGGTFYPDSGPFPAEYRGNYFFADYCSGWIRVFDPVAGTARGFATGAANPLDLRVGADGALYYLAAGSSGVYRVAYATPAPLITTQPASLTRNANEAAVFSVTATGAAPLSYQWQRDGLEIPNATSALYTITAVTAGDNGDRFRVRVRNASGEVLSNEAVLTVTAAPAITSQPASLTRTVGEAATFAVTVTGATPFSYQWQRDGADIGGATAATFTLASVALADSGDRFRVRVRNAAGEVLSSEATLTVNPAITITSQPASLARTVGEAAAFSVTATGAGSLSYQWQRGGADISGATSATYNLASVALADNGARFRVRVRSGANELLSAEAVLTVNAAPAPVITSQPVSLTRTVGQAAAFAVTATGAAPLSYQWQRGGVDIGGATSAALSIASVTMADNGARFRVRVRGAGGGETMSAEAVLSVSMPLNRAPVVTILTPATGTLYHGGMVLGFSASATDPEDGPLPASAFSWTIVFHHDDHTHPFVSDVNGVAAGTAEIPNRGETSTNVFYRIRVTVRDSQGMTATATRDVMPRVVTLRLESNFNPVRVTLDGQPAYTPVNVRSVAGMIRSIGAPLRQKLGMFILRYAGWSDGGEREHEIVTPNANTTYRVLYR